MWIKLWDKKTIHSIGSKKAGSAFSCNFWFFLLTSFCFSLTASSLLFAFAWFAFAVLIMRHAACESTSEPEDRAVCSFTVPSHSSSSAVYISSIASCSSLSRRFPLPLNDVFSCLSFFWPLVLDSSSSASLFFSASFFFFSTSSSFRGFR